MFAVVLDTSVLWPNLQRDFLLSLAVERLYRPLWTTAILDELEYVETRKFLARGDTGYVAAQRARHLIERMSSAFDDALVHNWEPLDGRFGLPDPDDEHVLAAAVVGGADRIVTHNVRDFPDSAGSSSDSRAQTGSIRRRHRLGVTGPRSARRE